MCTVEMASLIVQTQPGSRIGVDYTDLITIMISCMKLSVMIMITITVLLEKAITNMIMIRPHTIDSNLGFTFKG